MAAEVNLSSREFERALAVLQREQEAYLPSARQEQLFRLFNWSVFSFVAIYVIFFLTLSVTGALTGPNGSNGADTLLTILSVLWLISTIAMIFLFLANLGLMLKLVHQARLRRELHLSKSLTGAFKDARKEGKIVNVLTIIIMCFGVLLVFGSIFFFFIEFPDEVQNTSWIAKLIICFAFIVLGLSLIFLHFMRRGKQRIDVIKNLQESVFKQKVASDSGKDIAKRMSSSKYNEIARLERAHIIDDRRRSIGEARKEDRDDRYLIQNSREMISGKNQLDPNTRAQVEMQILELVADPSPPAAIEDFGAGYMRIPVPDTSIEIMYQIDQDRRRIQLLSLQDRTSQKV